MNDNELNIPPKALTDPNDFKLLRLWAAHEQLHVSFKGNLSGEAEDFGELLADHFEHSSRLIRKKTPYLWISAAKEFSMNFNNKLPHLSRVLEVRYQRSGSRMQLKEACELNWLFVVDMQYQNAASRRMLPAEQRQR